MEDDSSLRDLLANIRCAEGRSQILLNLQQIVDFGQKGGQSHYGMVLSTLLSRFTPSFLGVLTKEESQKYIRCIFLSDVNPCETFLALHDALNSSKDAYMTEKLLEIMAQFVTKSLPGVLEIMVAYKTTNRGDNLCDDLLCQSMSNLVDVCCKKAITHGVLRKERYGTVLATAMCRNVELVYCKLMANTHCSLVFLSKLLAKLFLQGLGENVLSILVPWIAAKIEAEKDTSIWIRISRKLIENCCSCIGFELLVTDWVLKAKIHSLPVFFGDLVLQNSCFKNLLTRKLILNKTFDAKYRIPEKISYYLSSSEARKCLAVQVFKDLILVWSDPGAISRTTVHQRVFISRCVVCFANNLTPTQISNISDEVLPKIMSSIQLHLKSGCETTQIMGQIVSMKLMEILQPDIPEKLDFELDYSNEIVIEMSKYILDYVEQDYCHAFDQSVTIFDEVEEDEIDIVKSQVVADFDSDDDIIAYDIPSISMPKFDVDVDADMEKPFTPPVYIRECLENLAEKKNRNKFEVNYRALPSLANRKSLGFMDIVQNLTMRVLNLENHFYLKDFEQIRLKTLVNCCCEVPAEVCPFLCSQLFATNYSISQRLLILDVFVQSAHDLHESHQANVNTKPKPKLAIQSPEWQKEIDSRVEKQTRYFHSKVEGGNALINDFCGVAHYFFYPLLTAVQLNKCISVDLQRDDCLVLARILYTLGYCMKCGSNSPHCLKMAHMLLDLVGTCKYHEQSAVRVTVVMCIKACIMALPNNLIPLLLQSPNFDLDYVKEIAELDSDEKCKTEATNCLIILQNNMQTHVNAQ